MKKQNILIEQYLCDDYEASYEINEYKYQLLNHLNDKLLKIKSFIGKSIKDSKETIINNKLNEISEEQNFYNLYLLLDKSIDTILDENNNMINKILEYINDIKELFNLYFKKYKDFLIIKSKFNTKLNEVLNHKNNFIELAKNAELFIYKFLKKKMLNNKSNSQSEFNQKEELKNIAKNELDKYKNKINEGNEILKIFNTSQSDLFKTEKELEIKYNETYSDSLMAYLEHQLILNIIANQTKETILKLNEKSNKKQLKDYLKNYRPQNEIEFEQYKTSIDIEACNDNIELTICFGVFDEFGECIGKYKEGELFEESKKMEKNKEIKRILHLDEKITDEDINKLIKIINNSIGMNIFINNLSSLRTSGQYKKSEIFIHSLGKVLNIILNTAEKEKDLDLVKNSIILSQTFYCLDSNKEKIYIFQFIKDNKWLKGAKFWKEYIEYMLIKEFERSSKYKNRNFNDILLTQLLTYINNMKDFEIEKSFIIKIIDECLEKYNYLNEESYNLLFSMISSDIEEIEKIRKEIKDNPKLEEEIIRGEEIINNNIQKKMDINQNQNYIKKDENDMNKIKIDTNNNNLIDDKKQDIKNIINGEENNNEKDIYNEIKEDNIKNEINENKISEQ